MQVQVKTDRTSSTLQEHSILLWVAVWHNISLHTHSCRYYCWECDHQLASCWEQNWWVWILLLVSIQKYELSDITALCLHGGGDKSFQRQLYSKFVLHFSNAHFIICQHACINKIWTKSYGKRFSGRSCSPGCMCNFSDLSNLCSIYTLSSPVPRPHGRREIQRPGYKAFHKWWHAVHEAYLCIGNQQVYPVCTRVQWKQKWKRL